MSQAESGRRWSREATLQAAIAVALVALVAAVYAPVRSHEFVDLDDWGGILYNADIRASSLGEAVRVALTRPMLSIWTPLTLLSFQLDWALYGPDPTGYLVTNAALHALSALLLFGALLAITGATGASAFVAAVFAVHPLHVESVAWASERKDALSGVFWMLTLHSYTYYVRLPASRARYALVTLCLGLGLLAKPMLVTLPCVLLLLDYWPFRRLGADAFREKLPLFALSGVTALINLQVQAMHGAMGFGLALPLWARLMNAVDSYAVYVQKTFWPSGLAAFYVHPGESLSPARVAAVGACLLALTAAAFATRRTRPYLLTGWLWFGGTLVPVIGIVQAGIQARADRYMYLPQIGLAIAVAFGVRDLVAGHRVLRRAAAAAAVAAVAALAFAAAAQVHTWRDSYALFQRALAVDPDAAYPHVRLGMLYAMGQDFPRARAHFELAFARDAGQQETVVDQLDSMAAAHAAMGRFTSAIHTADLALDIARASGQPERERALRERLADYRAGRRPAPAPRE